MPPGNKRSRQAKAQHTSGRQGFDSGWTDTFQEILSDPTYDPDLDNTADIGYDTSGSDLDDATFALIDGAQAQDDRSGAEEGSEMEESSDDESDVEDHEAMESVKETHNEEKPAPSKKPRQGPAVALPSYTGAGRSSIYANQKELRRAAAGCKKITSFFSHDTEMDEDLDGDGSDSRAESETMPDMQAESSGSPVVTVPIRNMDEFWSWIDRRTTPSGVAAADQVSHQDQAGTASTGTAPDAIGAFSTIEEGVDADADVESMVDMEEWLVMDFHEDDSGHPSPQLIDIVEALIKAAKRHKSFSALFKLESVKAYLGLLGKYEANPRVKDPKTRASNSIATGVGRGPYFAKQIRRLAVYIERFRTLPPTNTGKHHAHPSLLNNEAVAHAVRRYLTVVAVGEITPLMLQRRVNEVIIPALGLNLGGAKISEGCARRWLHKLGYNQTEAKKGMYVDGHERPDVIAYRTKLLEELARYEHLRTKYDDRTLEPIPPVLQPGERLHVPVFQDESIFRSNDLRRRVWVKDGKTPLRKKGQGRAIHVSDFIVEQTGRLKLSQAQIDEQNRLPESQRVAEDAREIIYPGKNGDGWWNAERLIAQVKQMLPLFEKLYPGAVGEFFFDQSTAHSAFAPDALMASEMNVNPGGKKRSMVLPNDYEDPALRGKPKGMRIILQERGLWEELIRRNGGKAPLGDCANCKLSQKAREKRAQEEAEAMAGIDEPSDMAEDDELLFMEQDAEKWCCMRKVISWQSDFVNEKPLLQIIIEERGHKCYFLPKFHCELNPIEMYWGWVKIRYRTLADGTWKRAKDLVPELLNSCETKTIRAFFRKSFRYMDAYVRGLNAVQAAYAVKKYKAHRKVGARIMMDVNILTMASD
ncbi:hypothetical protein H1R20_g14444, partial [Candolleomyces eurysporus]